jgi:hypothetical protein
MVQYLSTGQFPGVRAAIDISLDASNLPDDVIDLPQYRGDAERWIVASNPDAATYAPGSEQYQTTQVAAIYACAALIGPAVPMLTGETYSDGYRYTRDKVDPLALADSLWLKARQALAAAMDTDVPALTERAPSRFVFTRAPGNRTTRIPNL